MNHDQHENAATTEERGRDKSGSSATVHTSTRGVSLPPPTFPAPPYIEIAEGGSHAVLRATPPPTPPLSKRAPTKKGTRGEVRGPTRWSMARLRHKLADVNQTIHPAETCAFVTLTYPTAYPTEPETWQAHTKALNRGLERRFGPVGTVAVKEFGRRRQAPHFHLVAVLPDGIKACEYTRVARRIWLEIAGDGSSAHERHGVGGGPLRSWRAVISYLTKGGAMPLEEGTNRPRRTGRMWSIWRPERLTSTYRTIPLSAKAYVVLRRIFRRLGFHSSGVSRLVAPDRFDAQHVLITEDDALRLLEHLQVSPP